MSYCHPCLEVNVAIYKTPKDILSPSLYRIIPLVPKCCKRMWRRAIFVHCGGWCKINQNYAKYFHLPPEKYFKYELLFSLITVIINGCHINLLHWPNDPQGALMSQLDVTKFWNYIFTFRMIYFLFIRSQNCYWNKLMNSMIFFNTLKPIFSTKKSLFSTPDVRGKENVHLG